MKCHEKRTVLINELKRTSIYDPSKKKFKFRYLYKDTVICATAFEKLYVVGHTTLVDVRRQINGGIDSVPPRKAKRIEKGQSIARLQFKAWFDNWKNGRGNPQPDSTDFHLAPGLKKKDVVKAYQVRQSTSSDTLTDSSGTCCSSSTGSSSSNLFGFLQNDFPHVKKRKHVRFTKCSVCTLIEDKKKKAKHDSRRQGEHSTDHEPNV